MLTIGAVEHRWLAQATVELEELDVERSEHRSPDSISSIASTLT